MTTSDVIQLVAILVSVIVSLISILQSSRSIKLTEKSILDANRPYVSVFVDTIDTSYFSKYIVVKNFGNSSAKILSIEFEGKLDEINDDFRMRTLNGVSIAPSQKFSTYIDEDFTGTVYANIKYQDQSGIIYNEDFTLKLDLGESLIWIDHKNDHDSKEATAIKQSAHAIIKAFK